MRLFLDTSVILAACGRPEGASHAIFTWAPRYGWRLLVGGYGLHEVERNLHHRLPPKAADEWVLLYPCLSVVQDQFTYPWPTVFTAGKDRPILFTAAATADVLLTLDRSDFGGMMTTGFYGLPVMGPGDFLRQERSAGRI